MAEATGGAIWRYMNLATYVSTLAHGLFFAKPSALGDQWEGAWGTADVGAFRLTHRSLKSEEMNEQWRAHHGPKQESLEAHGVSCWHRSDVESAALWAHYVNLGLGVAIRSTPARVMKALSARGGVSWHDVTYGSYEGSRIGNDPINLLSRKRPEFKHEHEIRFIIRFEPREVDAIEARRRMDEYRSKRPLTTGKPRPLVQSIPGLPGLDLELLDRATPAGVFVEADHQELLEKVFLSPDVPYPVRRAVGAATEKFGLSRAVVTESGMDEIPPDVLRFYDD